MPEDFVPLVESGAALDSMRNSDFDVLSAYGEIVDNSIQAGARKIAVRIDYLARTSVSRWVRNESRSSAKVHATGLLEQV